MKKGIIVFVLLVISITSSVVSLSNTTQDETNSYQIIVDYPKQVLFGQTFNVSFALATSIINSTEFEYMTPGTNILNISGQKAYEGSGGYFLVDKVNISNATELIVSFVGTLIGPFSNHPGIVLYSYNFSPTRPDSESGIYEILLEWGDSLWINKLQMLLPVAYDLPSFYSGNYTVVFKDVNSSVCIYSVSANSNKKVIEYNTGIPWDSIDYVGIRTDTDTVLPQSFTIIGNSFISISQIPYKYVVYVNGKEYSSGNSSEGTISLKASSSMTINITYPQLNLYKVITLSFSSQTSSNPSSQNGVSLNTSTNVNVVTIKIQFPILQVALLVITGVLIGLGIWKEIKK